MASIQLNTKLSSVISWGVCWVFLITVLWAGHDLGRWKTSLVIRWDASGYYCYLPAVFIYHDLFHAQFLPEVSQKYRPADSEFFYAMHPLPNGKVVDKYTLGVAVLELPFFLLGHIYALNSGQHPPDGWSLPYQTAILLSGIMYGFWGLYFLRKILRLLLPEPITAITLFAIAFATNFFYYALIEGGLSHIYLFFGHAVMLYNMICWYKYGYKLSNLLWVSAAIAWAVMCRPTEIFVVLLPLLYGVTKISDLPKQIRLLGQHKYKILLALLVGLAVLSPQLLYWKLSTGSWIFYSYVGEGFDFAHPHIIDGLFSYRKGWFLYTPLALLIPVGIVALWFEGKGKPWALSSSLFFVLYIYVTFSWTTWAYGGSFGARALVQALPIFSIAIGFLLHRLAAVSKLLLGIAVLFIVACAALNLFQTHQYHKGILVWDNMNKAYYWRIFGKTSVTEEDRKLLRWW